MKTMKTLAILAASLTIAATAQAQELKTANFLDNYLYGYRLNPSVTPSRTAGFFGIGVGNIGLTADTNFGVSNFLFPLEDGTLVTGLNKAVTEAQFPGGMEEMNRLNANISENILAFGIAGSKGSYGHFEINLVSQEEVGVPRALFEAFKCKNTTGSYQVKNLHLNTTNYLEVAYGRSKRKGNLAIGWTLKGLVGVAKLNAAVDMEINTAGDNMWVRSKGSLQAAAAPISIGIDENGNYDFSSVGLNTQSIKPSGFGAAVDLGVSYYLLKDRLILGAAARNLGRMKWNNNLFGENSGDKVYINLNDTDDLGDAFKDMIKFSPAEGNRESKMETLPMSFNLSAKLKPLSILTLGVVGTINKYSAYSSKDIRFGAAFTPFRQLNIAGSYSIGDMGSEIGVAASVRLLGINVYAGIDAIQMTVTPQYLPVNPVSTTVNAGVALAFGKSSAKAAKEKADNKKAAKEKTAKDKKSSKKK